MNRLSDNVGEVYRQLATHVVLTSDTAPENAIDHALVPRLAELLECIRYDIEIPLLSPAGDGGVRLAWTRDGRGVYVYIQPYHPYRSYYVIYRLGGREVYHTEAICAAEALMDLLGREE